MAKPIALITGASSGIGAELARIFAVGGYDLILAARREAKLAALAEELSVRCRAEYVVVDLSRVRGPVKLADEIAELGREVDVLVNNAGVMESGAMLGAPRRRFTNLINLNVRALTELVHIYGSSMAERGYGRILNVASVASFQPVPGLAVYAASKAFVLSLTESLSEELRGSGVTITALCPGPTRTEMAEAFEDAEFVDWFLADAKSVAQEGYDAMKAGQVIRVPGLANQALVTWSQFQPRWLVRTVTGFTSRFSPFMK